VTNCQLQSNSAQISVGYYEMKQHKQCFGEDCSKLLV